MGPGTVVFKTGPVYGPSTEEAAEEKASNKKFILVLKIYLNRIEKRRGMLF